MVRPSVSSSLKRRPQVGCQDQHRQRRKRQATTWCVYGGGNSWCGELPVHCACATRHICLGIVTLLPPPKQKMKTLRHPNVLASVEALDVEDAMYIVTEPVSTPQRSPLHCLPASHLLPAPYRPHPSYFPLVPQPKSPISPPRTV